MHEFALAQELIERVLELARPYGGAVAEVELKVGELTAVNRWTLGIAFEALKTESSLLTDCRLLCCPVPVLLRCQDCGGIGSPIDPLMLLCPTCSSARVQVRSGRELDIVRLRLDG